MLTFRCLPDPARIHQTPLIYPRQFIKKETLDSLSHWQNYVKITSEDLMNTKFILIGENIEDRAKCLDPFSTLKRTSYLAPILHRHTHQIKKTSTSMQTIWQCCGSRTGRIHIKWEKGYGRFRVGKKRKKKKRTLGILVLDINHFFG